MKRIYFSKEEREALIYLLQTMDTLAWHDIDADPPPEDKKLLFRCLYLEDGDFVCLGKWNKDFHCVKPYADILLIFQTPYLWAYLPE
jgi:hypothetical protein